MFTLTENEPGKEGERFFFRWMLRYWWKTRACINRDKRSSFEEHRFVLEFDLYRASRNYEIALFRVINHLFTSSRKETDDYIKLSFVFIANYSWFSFATVFPNLVAVFTLKYFHREYYRLLIFPFLGKISRFEIVYLYFAIKMNFTIIYHFFDAIINDDFFFFRSNELPVSPLTIRWIYIYINMYV